MAVLQLLVTLYIVVIVLVVIGSWIRIEPGSRAEQGFLVLRRLTDPVLEPVRRLVPPVGGALDLSPTIVIFLLLIVRGLLA